MVEHFFRHESAKLVATLTGIFGLENWSLAEDVVQEAMIRAFQTWPYHGPPRNPSAWITQVAKNLALDVVRRETVFRDKQPEITRLMEQPQPELAETVYLDRELRDDRLRMMFVCCHPVLPAEAQVALALKTLCGFNVPEISRGFLTSEAAIAKRLTRAKQTIRDAGITFEIPVGDELARRLDGILQTLYLVFNEGYKASTGDRLIREDLCQEAIRLTELLVNHQAGSYPKTHALLALMLFNAARLSSRVDAAGNLLRLKEQDRTSWDQRMIARGMFHLAKSADGNEITGYHVQAGIAACHCRAKEYASTDWGQILDLYDRYTEFDDSPVVALNRAIALANLRGPQAGLDAVAAIKQRSKLDSYYLLYAALGEFEAELNRMEAAAAHFRKAMELAEIKSEQAFLARRLQACLQQSTPPTD